MKTITRIMSTCTLLVTAAPARQILSELKRQMRLQALLARLVLVFSILACSGVSVEGQEMARHG
jgi:hypothetical protein